MDPITARLECLRLAAEHATDKLPGTIKNAADEWAKFVLGPDVQSSKNQGKKGADDPK